MFVGSFKFFFHSQKERNWNYSKNLLLNKTLSISEPLSISVSALSSFNKTPTHAHGATINPSRRIPPQMRNILLSVTFRRISKTINCKNFGSFSWWKFWNINFCNFSIQRSFAHIRKIKFFCQSINAMEVWRCCILSPVVLRRNLDANWPLHRNILL